MKDEAAAGTTQHEAGHPSPETASAFIIDDDALMADLLARRLERRGFSTRSFDDPERLLAELAREAPAVLFSDLMMPRMGGAEIISRARRGGFAGLVVLITASRENAAIGEALRSGADLVLAKPPRDYDLDWLCAKARLGGSPGAGVEHLAAALEHVDQGALVVDEECVPLCVNARARRTLGIGGAAGAVEALERVGIASRIMEGRHGGIAFVEASGPGGAARNPVGVEVREIGGSPRPLRIVLLHDFSERRRIDELQSQFASYLSHRMRTPLTSVRNAVSILCSGEAPLEGAERERFLDIGCRNIERLVNSLDELQKAFMAESGESSGCRALMRLDRGVDAVLAEAQRSAIISGFRLRAPASAAIVSRARLEEFIRSAVAAMAGRLECAPHVECVVAVREDTPEFAGRDPEISIVLSSRTRSAVSVSSLEEYIASRAGDTKLVLERIARSLGGEIAFPGRETIRLAVPAEPRFDRDLDLVQPFHLMLERARLSSAEFNLVSIRAALAREDGRAFARLLADALDDIFAGEEAIVAQGESPLSFSVFTCGVPRARVAAEMENLRARFARSCRDRGEEIFPALRWDVAYHSGAVSSDAAGACPFVESYLPQ